MDKNILELEKFHYQVYPKSRKVYFAKGFQYPNDNEIVLENFKIIVNKIEKGENINPYMSKQYKKGKPDFYHRSYKIHHLHVPESNKSNEQEFVSRSRYRVFVGFTDNEAYLLYMDTKHDDKIFANGVLLDILKQNGWLDKFAISVNVSADSIPDIPQDVKNYLRKSGIVFLEEISGKVIIQNPVLSHGETMETFLRRRLYKDIKHYIQQMVAREIAKINNDILETEMQNLDNEINKLCLPIYRLFGFTQEEISVIENKKRSLKIMRV